MQPSNELIKPVVSNLALSNEDLYSPRVEAFIEEQSVIARATPEAPPRAWYAKVLYSSCFYLSFAGMLGALVAWAVVEPFFNDENVGEEVDAASVLLFPTVAAGVGLFLGAAEGIMCRNAGRAGLSAVVGLGAGFLGGLLAVIPTGLVFMGMVAIAMEVGPPRSDEVMPRGFGFLLLMMGRGMAWTIAALPAGLGQGLALRDKKVAINGIVGAVMGGLLGGMFFDPIDVIFGDGESAAGSRAVGFAFIGACVGLFTGLVEQWTKTAWLHMRAGPLAGKQFIVFRNPTVLGSSPKCDIYLFKDAAIEPRHALIHDRGGRYEIEDLQSKDGTYVNGRPVVGKRVLQAGDTIVLGKTVLEFALRDKERA